MKEKSMAKIRNSYILGPLLFNPENRRIDMGHKTVSLTVKETCIMAYMVLHQSRPVSKSELLAEVWGYNQEINTHTVETHIYRLRRKIIDLSGSNLISNEEGLGYALTC